MKPIYRNLLTALLSTALLSGCFSDSNDGPAPAPATPPAGGGTGSGSTSTPTAPTTPTTTPTTLNGVAMAGAIDNGTVCAYAQTAAGTWQPDSLACGATDSKGAYRLSWSNYTGPVLLKAFGQYLDEATNQRRTITQASALRSVANCTTTSCNAAVTPLTEAAVRSAATHAWADLAASYLKVAQAFGLNPTDATDATAKLVTRLPASSGDDAAKGYANLLAVVSQAQVQYCGSSCDLETYLSGLADRMSAVTGVTDIRSSLNAALAAWNSNANNTSKAQCSFGTGVITCTLPSGGNGSGSGSASGGNYKLSVTVNANGIPTPAIIINNTPKPTTQSEFCNAPEVQQQLNSSLGSTGTWTMNSCTFNGTTGQIAATVTITSPVNMSIPYTINYVYSAM